MEEHGLSLVMEEHGLSLMMEEHFGLEPLQTDIFVAVMGMTGAGKSTFISLCSGEDVAVGHDLQACTQKVSIYKCKFSSSCDVYLLDTPGFDDTNRSDTEVLKEIASWLASSYRHNLKLSGILYLHRITDLRMQGSAKKNLFMLKKLCGTDGLKNVLLVSTMWELVETNVGPGREEELINTDEFWGVLVRGGARVKRHDNSRDSAMRLLKEIVKNKKMAMSIQKEMVTEGKTLDQTQTGIELESELRKQRERFQKELAEVQEMMREVMLARDQESAEALRQHKAETQLKLDKIMREREELRGTLDLTLAKGFAEFERRHREQREEIRRREESHKEELLHRSKLEEELREKLDLLSVKPGERKHSSPRADTRQPVRYNNPSPLATPGSYEETELRGKRLSKEHPDILASTGNLAYKLYRQGKYEEAEQQFRKTIELRRKVLGEEHPGTLSFMGAYAATLHKQGKHDEAEREFRQTLELMKKVLGEEHVDTVACMMGLAIALREQENYEETEQMFRKILEIRRKVLGEEHPKTLQITGWLTRTLREQGKYDGAKQNDRQARKLRGEKSSWWRPWRQGGAPNDM